MVNQVLASLLVAWLSPPPPAQAVSAETFDLGGAAQKIDGGCIRLTPDAQWASGSAWARTPLDLSAPFDLEMSLAFGSRDRLGADGIVFVLAPAPETGWRGEGLGYAGLRGSLGIELDTYANRRQNDPQADHLALVTDGVPFHHEFAPVELPNLEDGQRHPFRVKWAPKKDTLEVYLDGILRATYPGAVVRAALGDAGVVSWGLTAGTGRKTNAHDVCFAADPQV